MTRNCARCKKSIEEMRRVGDPEGGAGWWICIDCDNPNPRRTLPGQGWMLLWDDQSGPCIERVIGFAEDTEGSFYPLTCTREAQGNWLAHGDPHGASNLVRLFHESEPHDKAQVSAWIEDHRKRTKAPEPA